MTTDDDRNPFSHWAHLVVHAAVFLLLLLALVELVAPEVARAAELIKKLFM